MSRRGHENRSNEQRKSVFDRLGQQLAASGQRQMNEPNFNHYGPRDSQPSQAELDWHYQNERRQQMNVPVKDRHHPPMNMGPPYQMEMMDRPAYYPPHMAYHDSGPPMPGPPMLGHSAPMPMAIHQRRDMQKLDSRQGNMMVGGFKDRPGPMRMIVGPPDPYFMGAPMGSPPPDFMGPRQMLPPGHEMSPMRHTGMYPPQRWPDGMEMAGQQGRMMPPDEPFGFMGYPPPHQPPMLNPESAQAPMQMSGQEVPRYAKWRERRDFITNLDRETAQSSSRTDSLKSSMQQNEPHGGKSNHRSRRHNNAAKQAAKQAEQNKSENKTANQQQTNKTTGTSEKNDNKPQDISDGEIVDDDDASDDSDDMVPLKRPNAPASDGKTQGDIQISDNTKRRRVADREDYSMDYETISDEDLDDFMGDKKLSELALVDAKSGDLKGQANAKNSSEMELLNTLGLDWAHLIEMSKQTRAPKESQTSGSALMRFSLQNYLPTLKITPDLAGAEITDLINKACRV